MNPYDYRSNDKPEVKLSLKKTTSDYQQYSVEFLSAFGTDYPENSIVKGEYYQPKVEHKTPLAILVHGMGDHSVVPCRLIARTLLKQGIACFILYLTIHSKRLPKAVRSHFPYLTSDEWFQSYQISVIDIRQIVDWAFLRDELDESRIVTLGISFGGFVSAIAMGVDTRISAGVFIVTGANSSKMNWLSKAGIYRKRYPQTELEYWETQGAYIDYLAEVSEKGFENIIPVRQSFLTDPLTFASYLKDRPVLMINARWDRYIPRETTIEFWLACGQPPIKWIPAGHSSIWFQYPTIRKQIVSFLKIYIP